MSTQSSFAEAAIAALNVSAVASYPPHLRRWAEADANAKQVQPIQLLSLRPKRQEPTPPPLPSSFTESAARALLRAQVDALPSKARRNLQCPAGQAAIDAMARAPIQLISSFIGGADPLSLFE